MAMTVQHNIQAQMALGELNRNNDKLRKSLEKVSSGQKINSAKDDSSAYVISEKMREMVRTLTQDNQNVQNGATLFKIADGGINSIVEELRNLKELAINAANDTNTDADRATIQKEFSQKYANINDIATTTNYNGKTLLDGTYYQDNIVKINGDDYNINSDGVYMLTKDFTGTVNVNAKNVKIIQEDPKTTLNNVSIIGSGNGNANLWIEDLNIKNTDDKNIIKFQGVNNVLTVKGNNNLQVHTSGNSKSATVNIGGGLTIAGDGELNVSIASDAACYGGAAIGGNGAKISSEIDTVGNLIIGSSVTIYAKCSGTDSAAIGSGFYGNIGDIKIGNNAHVTATATLFGASSNCTGAAIGAAHWGSAGNIEIGDNATIIAQSYNGAGIGTGHCNSRAKNITISISAINNSTISSNYGQNIGLGQSTPNSVGIIRINSSHDVTVSTNALEPKKGISATKYNPLKIHHGTKANQATNFYINDMHTKFLGIDNAKVFCRNRRRLCWLKPIKTVLLF